MSTAILDAFLTLLTDKPEIIQDWDNLQLQLSQSHEDVDELADVVAEYCQAHIELQAAIKSELEKPKPKLDLDPDRLPGNGNTRPALQVADYKYTILNTMHRVVATPVPAKKP
jgi:hypothetical protein